ncbi:hypothetical protein N7540_007811 [Penicillium herquei]|nr:hypothetical protein N7540_007811 [Penicillium herquei]
MVSDYVLGRDLYASMRLDAQHLLWKLYNGYTLNPEIPITEDMKIAEIGTGTGMWLLDLSSQVPEGAQLDGFDLSEEQFPHKSTWPANINFRTVDAFGEVPRDLVHRYDVVHLRFWCCVVRNNDPSALIRHAKMLLKPGGYIQWEDADLQQTLVHGPVAEEFGRIAKLIFAAAKFDFHWIGHLKEHIHEHGLNVMKSELGTIPPSLIPLCTSTYLTGHLELFQAISALSDPQIPNESTCRNLLMRLLTEVKKGAVYHWRPITLLAQKPLEPQLNPQRVQHLAIGEISSL